MNRATGALAGIAGVIVFIAGALFAGRPPDVDASTGTIVNYMVDNRSQLLGAAIVQSVGALLLLFFLGSLVILLFEAGKSSRPLAIVTAASWTMLFATFWGSTFLFYAVAWRGADRVDGSVVQLTWDVGIVGAYALIAAISVASVVAPSVVIITTGVLPKWIGYAAAAVVAVNLVEMCGISTRTGSNAGGFATGAGPYIWSAWVLALAIMMLINSRGVEEPEDA
jgi:hypothetical protein